jgi:hypothetical protein
VPGGIVNNLILSGAIAIALSITGYKIISGFLYDVTLRRLTKASFNISLLDFIDLSLAYFIAMLSFLFINLYLKQYFSFAAEESIVLIGLILIYMGRIITKHQGMLFGKLHFSAILTTSSILLIIDFIRTGKFAPTTVISSFNPYTISNVYDTSINITMNYINFLYDGKQFDENLLFEVSCIGLGVFHFLK